MTEAMLAQYGHSNPCRPGVVIQCQYASKVWGVTLKLWSLSWMTEAWMTWVMLIGYLDKTIHLLVIRWAQYGYKVYSSVNWLIWQCTHFVVSVLRHFVLCHIISRWLCELYLVTLYRFNHTIIYILDYARNKLGQNWGDFTFSLRHKLDVIAPTQNMINNGKYSPVHFHSILKLVVNSSRPSDTYMRQ